MKVIFEIPIYALTEKSLNHRVAEYEIRIKNELGDSLEYSFLRETPQRYWRYNHIVGYILIYKEKDDLYTELFLPEKKIKRYYWKSAKKKFIKNHFMNGTHIYLPLYDNNDIISYIDELLIEIKKRNIPKSYYIDREAYDNIKYMIDFMSV